MSTLTTYRQTLAPLLGVHERGTASASATNNTAGQLEATTASHTGLRFKSTVNAAGLLEDKWLFVPAAAADDRDRLIARYVPASGFLVPDDVWSAAQTSRAFEIHGLFSGTETHLLLNEGLKRCFVVVEFTYTTPTTGRRRHPLSETETWLIDPRWVFQVGLLGAGELRAQTNPFARTQRGALHKDGSTVYLEGPSFALADTVYVKAIKPAYDHCRPQFGDWGDQSGLSLETDEAPVDPTWLAWAAVLAGRDRIDAAIEEGSAAEVQKAVQARSQASARFSDLTRKNLSLPERTVYDPSWLGPTLGPSWRR